MLDAHKCLSVLGSEGHILLGLLPGVQQVESDAWGETANLPSKKLLGECSRGLGPVCRVFEGPSGKSDCIAEILKSMGRDLLASSM